MLSYKDDDRKVEQICKEEILPMIIKNLEDNQNAVDQDKKCDGFEIAFGLSKAFQFVRRRVIKEVHSYHMKLGTLKSAFTDKRRVSDYLDDAIVLSTDKLAREYVDESSKYNVVNFGIHGSKLEYWIEPRKKRRFQEARQAINWLSAHKLSAHFNGYHVIIDKKFHQDKTGVEVLLLFDENEGILNQILVQPNGNDPWGEWASMDSDLYLDNKDAVDFVTYTLTMVKKMFMEVFDIEFKRQRDN